MSVPIPNLSFNDSGPVTSGSDLRNASWRTDASGWTVNVPGLGSAASAAGGVPTLLLIGAAAVAAWWLLRRGGR